MKKIFFTFVIFSAFTNGKAQTSTVVGSTTLQVNDLFSTTQVPWEMLYGPNDSLWLTTRNGMVYRINAENGGNTLLLNHTANVIASGESGMLGMALHPQFATNPFVYIAYTYNNAGAIKERLSRFTYSGNTLINEIIFLNNIEGNTTHDGSRLVILPDNTLLMSTGDAQNQPSAQNANALTGKTLRINLDGSIPTNNPFANSYVYTLGHRNPQGLFVHPNGKIYSTEHGPDSNDEFQIIEAGRNYGWPNVFGFCDNDRSGETSFCTANNVKEPLASWNVIPGGTWAPSDLVWYNSAAIPEFQNSFLVTFLKTQKITRVQLNAAGDAVIGQQDFLVNQYGRLRDIATAPNGDIFLATNANPSKIIRLRNLSVLPVNFNDIKTTCNNTATTLSFTANTETNTKQYLIYAAKSINATFNLVATLPAKLNTATFNTYNFTSSNNDNYFKIIAENIDGKKKESAVVFSNCGDVKTTFTISPNPTFGNAALQMQGTLQNVQVQLFTSNGIKVFEQKAAAKVDLPTAKFSKGLYFVIVKNVDGKIIAKEKLIVH